MPDAIFAERRLAEIYDPLDPDRGDLDVHAALIDELGARSVLDIGCGTGTFACMLANRGIEVTAVDPAGASLDVARRKPGAEAVRWLESDAAHLPPMQVDMATMTGNVAQVFIDDDEWAASLGGICSALGPGGHLVFETRDPAKRAWQNWVREKTERRVEIDGVGWVETWTDLIEASLPLVSFRHGFRFEVDGVEITSESTLRFRTQDELRSSLDEAGFAVDEVRDAPDRPGLEWVFIASRAT